MKNPILPKYILWIIPAFCLKYTISLPYIYFRPSPVLFVN